MNIAHVDPELVPVLDSLRPRVDPIACPEDARAELVAKLKAVEPSGYKGVERRDRHVSGSDGYEIWVRLYLPDRDAPGLFAGLLWIHGGGFVMGTIEMDDALCASFAARFGCVVCSVEYRLAPENPYPIGLEDCYSALSWLVSNADDLRVDPARIGIGGVSAGGGLAAALSLLVRDRGAFTASFLLAQCAMLDDRRDRVSKVILDDRVWDEPTNRKAWGAYLSRVGSDVPSYAAASRAVDLTDLPPTFLMVGALDPFCDENLDFALRLRAADVPVELHVYPGGFHGFEVLGATARVSQAAIAARDAALERFAAPAQPVRR